ncbi:MAG: hypothetical protein WCI96_13395, partial [Planctomycetota bacterium]
MNAREAPTTTPVDAMGRAVQIVSDARATSLRPLFGLAGTPLNQPTFGALLHRGAKVDPIGLATVLSLGYAVAGRTVLAGVSCKEVDVNGFAATRVANAAELEEIVTEAVRASLGSQRPMVLLSGGRDSRLILLVMRKLAIRPSAVLTLAQRGAQSDAAVAVRLAAALGEPIERVAPLCFDGLRELDRHAMQSFQSLEHEWFMAISQMVRARGHDLYGGLNGGGVTDGIGAGVLSTGSLLHPEAMLLWKDRRIEDLFDWTAAHGSGVSAEFLAAARAEGVPLAERDAVVNEFAGVMRSLESTPNPLGMYSLMHWTRRGIGASAYGQLPHELVRTPLFDEHLCRALAAMDSKEALAADWRETMLRRLDDTGIPFSKAESGVLPRWMRYPVRSVRSRLGWIAFVRGLSPALKRLATVADATVGQRRSFDRAAVGLLASLDRSTGFLSEP